MNKIKVLFVCIHNSVRSQMAEALLQHHTSELFLVDSAGLEPGDLNPLAIKAMQDINIDISNKETNSVFDFLKEGRTYNYVITVCDESNSERCPLFPGNSQRLHWSFDDPSALTGSEEKKLKRIIEIRAQIKVKILEFIEKIKEDLT